MSGTSHVTNRCPAPSSLLQPTVNNNYFDDFTLTADLFRIRTHAKQVQKDIDSLIIINVIILCNNNHNSNIVR